MVVLRAYGVRGLLRLNGAWVVRAVPIRGRLTCKHFLSGKYPRLMVHSGIDTGVYCVHIEIPIIRIIQ
jgi:hypothetical protein